MNSKKQIHSGESRESSGFRNRDYNDNWSANSRVLDNRRSSRLTNPRVMKEKLDNVDNENNKNEGPTSGVRGVSGVGISQLPAQIRRRAVKKGFSFNLMVVGEAGLGKSTLVNSMFLSDIYSSPGLRPEKTVRVEQHHAKLEEDGVKLDLTVIDTPGFGDVVDNTNCWQPIAGYLEEQFCQYLEDETRVVREGVADSRVHALLYFLPPTGHGVRAIDIETMKRLHDKVNLIPLIAKADSFTKEELQEFKQNICNQLTSEKISFHNFSTCRHQAPLAVVGSNTVVEEGEGKKVWGRRYPWGTVSIEDPDHCDFSLLRSLLLARNTMDLINATHNLHYENFRCKELSSLAAIDEGKPTIPNKNPLAVIEDETSRHKLKVKKMEEEMEEVFCKKVEEKHAKIEKGERDAVQRMRKEQEALEEERQELAQRREEYQRELKEWEEGLETVSLRTASRTGSISSINSTTSKASKNFKFKTLFR